MPGLSLGVATAAGTVLDAYASTVGIALGSGLAAYWIYLSVSTLTSMATSQDPRWWEYHFSHISLIIAGFFVTTFALYLDRDLTVLVKRGVLVRSWSPAVISRIFVVLGVMLAGVGVFPLDVSIALHNTSAAGMAVSFALLLLASPFILKGLPVRFFLVCGGFFVAIFIRFVAAVAEGEEAAG